MMKYYPARLKTSFLLCVAGFSAGFLQAQDTSVTTIEADGPGDTYALLEAKLGGSPLEVPDCDHEETFQHIEEVYDETLAKHVFKFYIHKDVDTDRCETNVDRQRNEIKAYDPSPDELKAIQREVVTYEWFFKIDEQFQPSSNFTHLFQLKAVGGNDAANPILTITPRKGDPDQLQLIHGRGNGNYTTVEQVDLSLIKGNWVKAFCKVIYAEDTGSLDFNLQLLDGTEVLTYVNEEIDMWRTGSSFVRPKWGIYRSLNDIASLRDEEVLFADFKITEIGACPVWYEDADADGLGDPDSFVYECERPEGYVQNNVDECSDWYEDSDGDGLGNPDESMYWCDQPDGYVANADDLDDTRNDALAVVSDKAKSIYPNPATASFQLLGHARGTQLFVYDLGGKFMSFSHDHSMTISHFKSGVYIVKTSDGAIYRMVKR